MADQQTLFRSVPMSYIQALVPAVVAEEFVDRIGRRGNIQFTDLNEDVQPFQRKYTPDIIKIQDTERQIGQLEDYLAEYAVPYDGDVVGDDLDQSVRRDDPQLVSLITTSVNEAFVEIRDQVLAERQLNREFTQYNDAIRVLRQIDLLVDNQMVSEQKESLAEMKDQQGTPPPPRSSNAVPLLRSANDREVGFRYFAGVVSIEQRVSFDRQVFLTSRGNSFIQFHDDEIGDRVPFVVFFLGEQLKRSLTRLCQFMGIQIAYESDSPRSAEELLQEAEAKANDLNRILNATKMQLTQKLREAGEQMRTWKISLKQEKAIRVTLNRFREHQGNVLRAEGWCPTYAVDALQNELDNVTRGKGVGRAVLTIEEPRGMFPTYFVTNEFTDVFQQVVDTYGVPRYQEFNPAVPTIITFPFLFGVMYGDMFHGSCIFLFASMFFIFDKQIRAMRGADMVKSFHEARFLLLFMGACAIYCGMIYNDCMSIAPNGWNGKQWGLYTNSTSGEVTNSSFIFIGNKGGVYSVGIDPSWTGTGNQLSFVNSLKMKLSVTLGVTQMTFGLFCKMANHIHEGDNISLIWEFIPQLIFMMVFFGYMIFMIFYKWTINFQFRKNVPDLISTLISMVLGVGSLQGGAPLFEDAKFQESLQQIFVILMFLMIPIMLCVKPWLLKYYHDQEEMNGQYGNQYEEVADEDPDHQPARGGGGHGGHGGHDDEEFSFSEIFIHQMIHTIEYVLGTVSNTASYLRLWALSLAHAELSEVFFQMTIRGNVNTGFIGVVMMVVGVFAFFMVTFAVLLVMDVLECFLHALRLHWVEFQNKFYYADGIAFKPFAYKTFEKED